MTAEPASRLAGLPLVDPQENARWTSVRIRASHPVPLLAGEEHLDLDVHVAIAGAGRMWTLEQWLAETHGTSLVVVAGGRVVHEWYAVGLSPQTLFLGASMTKSVLTLLVGQAVRDGVLTVDAAVTDLVPELAGGGYAGCRVRDLLTMTTGVDWVEDHRDPTSAASRLLATFGAGAGGSRRLLTEVRPDVGPGTRWSYSTADSQVLDWVREAATGVPFPRALQRLWRSLGCECDAFVALDAPDGVAMAGGGLAACARDWARTALLLRDGAALGEQVVDPPWTAAASVPSLRFLEPGRLPSGITTHAGFGWAWWPLDREGRRVTADGSRGQFAYLDRDLDVVVVKTSAWPYDDWLVDRQLRDLSYLGLVEVARTAAAAGVRPPHEEVSS
jgi:CubicO group peptidase (beta-lactamase class C family)